MAEDLLDYWVRLIKTILPANAWINALCSHNDYLIQVDWKLQQDSKNATKRSKKIMIIVKELAINDYLDKSKKDREQSDLLLEAFVCKQYDHFNSVNDTDANPHAAAEKWVISPEVINGKSPADMLLGDRVASVCQ